VLPEPRDDDARGEQFVRLFDVRGAGDQLAQPAGKFFLLFVSFFIM